MNASDCVVPRTSEQPAPHRRRQSSSQDSAIETFSSVGQGNSNLKRRKNQDSHQESQNETLKNLIDLTCKLMVHKDPTKHVSTFAERSALKLLKRFGSILIKGRSGSGKSRLALRLLEETYKETNRKPILLSFSHEWKHIPQSQGGQDFVVMIDDMFGSSNLVQSQVDEWTRLFDIIWPSVESGHIFLVITSRPEIFAQSTNKIKSYRLMKNTKCVDLDSSDFAFTSLEKQKLLRKACGQNDIFTANEISRISNMKTSLGFPQCCEFFASNKTAQSKGVLFFLRPYLILKEVISIMKECDPTGYAVMLLLLMSNGFLRFQLFDPFQTNTEFERLVSSLSQICSFSSPPSPKNLKLRAEHLCGVYLARSDEGYHFQHQSIFDAVFLDIAKEYPEMCIKMCPVQMLIQFVRTDGPNDDEILIHLPGHMYGILADRITELLFCESDTEILDHPSMNHVDFFQYMTDHWKSNIVENVALFQTESIYVVYTKQIHRSVYVSEIEYMLFEVDNLLAHMLLRCTAMVRYIFESSQYIQNIDVSPQVLTCAISTSQNHIVSVLLDRNIVPEESCVRALCESQGIDDCVTERLLHQVVCDFKEVGDPDDLLYLASLNGNTRLVEFLMGKWEDDKATNAYNCLYDLFSYFKHTQNENIVLNEGFSQNLKDVVKFLLGFIPLDDEDTNDLFYLSAFHAHSIGLKALLERGETFRSSQDTECLSIALQHGGSDCVDVLLSHCFDKDDIRKRALFHLLLAAVSTTESHKKIKMLLQLFSDTAGQNQVMNFNVNNTNDIGTTTLHISVNFGNIEAIHVLKEHGASVNVQDKWGISPLHTAVKTGQLECIVTLLDAGADVNIADEHGETVLFYAEQESIARRLVDAGCNVNATDKFGNLAVHKAVQRNDVKVLTFLLRKGTDINSSNNHGVSLLHLASELGDHDVLEYLSGAGAKPTVDNDGTTVLHRAAKSLIEPVEKLRYLIDVLHVPVNVTDKEERTALFPAMENGDMEVIEFLIERGLNLKHKDQHGNTLLHALSFGRSGHLDCDRISGMLLDGGVDPDEAGYGKRTALHMVLEHDTWIKSTSLCTTLIDKTTKVNAKDDYGRTPLHHAARYGNVNFVELLLAKGADKELKDVFDCTAVDYVHWYEGKDADHQKAELRRLLGD